jgi:hypothetical protein
MEARKHKGGTSSQRRLAASLRVRLSPDDASQIAAKAQAAEVSVSTYIRVATLGYTRETGGERAPRRQPSNDDVALAKVLAQLGKIGSNLNQLARAANCGDWPSEPELVESARAVRETCGEIMRALGRRA